MINESKILELIKRQKDSGLTITAYCVNEAIPKSSFYYWRKKLSNEPTDRFIPLPVNSSLTPMTVPAKDSNRRETEHNNSGDDFILN
jgi:hypothetical protein